MFMKDPSIVEKLIPGVTNVQVIAQGGQKLVFRAQHSKYGEVVLIDRYSCSFWATYSWICGSGTI